jgi:ABC-type uncharacterized transport system permease subunit
MSRIEVKPGQFSQMAPAVSLKVPAVMAFFGLIVLFAFGLFGSPKSVAFQLTEPTATFRLADLNIGSNALGSAIGSILLLMAALATLQVRRKKSVPIWWSLTYGLLAVIALLGWLAAGNQVPVSFILGNAILLAVPIILGAMGGVMSERVGVVNIAIEGQLLTGAFVSAVVASLTHNLWAGLVAAMIAAAALSMVLASLAIKYLVEQIIIGVLLNVLVLGITNFLYAQWLSQDGEHVNYPGTFDIISIPFLSEIPVLGPSIFTNRVIVFLTFILVPVLWFVLFRTRLGLRARAVGEHPLAADTVGINVARTRFWWVTLGGAVAGMGGAALTIGNVGAFGQEMSGGQGFIALAVVILGRWQPLYVSASALLFGFTIILRIWANQVSPGIPTDFITMIPYVVTLIAVAGFAGRVRAPAADGQPYVKG